MSRFLFVLAIVLGAPALVAVLAAAPNPVSSASQSTGDAANGLRISNIQASSAFSFLPLTADKLIDGTPASWCEGVKGEGRGETVSFTVTAIDAARPVTLGRLFIQNGIGDPSFFRRNNRVRELEIRSGERKFVAVLKDTDQPQEILFPVELRAERGPLRVKAKILSAYLSKLDNDTCLAEIALRPIKADKTTPPPGAARPASALAKKNSAPKTVAPAPVNEPKTGEALKIDSAAPRALPAFRGEMAIHCGDFRLRLAPGGTLSGGVSKINGRATSIQNGDWRQEESKLRVSFSALAPPPGCSPKISAEKCRPQVAVTSTEFEIQPGGGVTYAGRSCSGAAR